MEGRRLLGTASMGELLQHESSCFLDVGAFLAPVAASADGLLESECVVNLDGAGNENGHIFCTPTELQEGCDDDSDGCLQRPEKKRRLTSHQVQFLEHSFELENRLEPERKIQIARNLGLQPRQIAIWFQNRRARCKTKQLEKEFEDLKSKYDNLKLDHDNLQKEKEELEAQVLSLTNKLLTTRDKDHVGFELPELHKFADDSLETGYSNLVSEVRNENAMQDDKSANSTVLDSDDALAMDESRCFVMMEPTCCSPNAFEFAQSDPSQVGDDAEFHLEDQFFWILASNEFS